MKLFRKNLRIIFGSKEHTIREKGQSLAEMCISMVMIIFILSGVVDIGRAYFAYISLEDAAGEAALFMSIYPNCPYEGTDAEPTHDDGVAGGDCDPPNNALWRARNAGGNNPLTSQVNWNDDSIGFEVVCSVGGTSNYTPTCLDDKVKPGDTVLVTIEYAFPLLSPVIPNIAGQPTLPLTGRASELIVAPRVNPTPIPGP